MSSSRNQSFEFFVLLLQHDMMIILWRLSLFPFWDLDTISFYTASQSIEMFNILERSQSCKVMEYPVVETYHLNFVCYCCNMTWWPFYGVCHCSHFEIWIQSHSIQLPNQLRCPTSWSGRIVVKLWNIQ